MQRHEQIAPARNPSGIVRFAVLGILAMLPGVASAQPWAGYGNGPQHNADAPGPSQLPQVIRWSTAVDLAPQYQEGNLYTHYGSPAITAHNTVLIPVKTGASGGFMVTAISSASGNELWSVDTDYELPAHNWIPPMGIALMPADLSVAIPGAGGTVLLRTTPDMRQGALNRLAFTGIANYNQNPAAFNDAIQINTPLTVDPNGNIYFGYVSSGAALPGYPNGIPSGLARVTKAGSGSYVAATALCGDASITKVTMNCTPALSADGRSVYVSVNKGDGSTGYLCQATADATLTPLANVFLQDPSTGTGASLYDDGTSSPTIGPDGDVYYGVLEANVPSGHNDRGWLLHFDSALTTLKIPGSFGWDITASVVPRKLVPAYTGASSYLVLTKYNNYANAGGNGKNMVAVLDPNATEPDPIKPAVQVMKEVITILGVTPNNGLPGVREWCINSAAIDQANKCAVINSEDGHVYRWSFATNTLSPGLQLAPPTGEAYTPTLIGPDGAVYAINNAKLSCCVAGVNATAVTPGGPSDRVAVAVAVSDLSPTLPIAGAPPAVIGIAIALVGATGGLLAVAVTWRRLLGATRLGPLHFRLGTDR